MDDSRAGSPLLLLSVRALARVRKVRPLSVGPLWLWNFSLTLLCGTVFTMLTLLADLGVGRDHHSLISTVFFLSLVEDEVLCGSVVNEPKGRRPEGWT